MSEELKDPNKAAHDIIEVLEDGDAIRNDGVRLTTANKNPWYVLATIYGEQEEGATWLDHDEELAEKNRQAWNGWLSGRLQSTKEEVEMTNRLRCRLRDDTAELPSSRKKADFSKVFFSTAVCFTHFDFTNDCQFSEAHFADNALFNSSNFIRSVNFIETTFSGYADFRRVEFDFSSSFRSALFEDIALFDSVNFNSNVCFQSATFRSGVGFVAASFQGEAEFDWYEYRGVGYVKAPYPVRFFGKVFFNAAQFQSKTRFNDAQFFTYVPTFHAAELFDDTVFAAGEGDLANWPPLKGEGVMPAADQKRAYNRLRLFMNRSLQIDEEQFFHRQEMRCKWRLAGWGHKPLFALYAVLSDFGNSVVRPLVGIIAVIALGALFMLWWGGAFTFTPQEAEGFDWSFGLLGEGDGWAKPREAVGWSLANAMPFLGQGKLYFADLYKELAWPLRVAGGVQTLLGYVLLFFLGLGLRNRFRLR